jgi:hypothetical protein
VAEDGTNKVEEGEEGTGEAVAVVVSDFARIFADC